MKNKNSSPTMKDVAKEAGVALGTVSKVVNGLPVGEKYRISVEKAIEKLNYKVNTYAKGLRGDKTYTIAVLVPNLINPYFSKLVHYLDKHLIKHNYQMLLCNTDYNPQLEQQYIAMAESKKVDGIICLSYNSELEIPDDMPFVSIDRHFGPSHPCVSSDNYGGGRLAAEKLYEKGCRNLAFMRIGSALTNEPNKRKDGFVCACEYLNIPYTLKIINDGNSFDEFIIFLKEHIHNGKLDFDGIFCVTDNVAYQITNALRSMGIRVPEDVQIIGYDGIRAFGDLHLICSTIVQPVEDIAATCVELILNKNSTKAQSLICLPIEFAYGGTTLE